MQRIGWIGTGVMGLSMAGHLQSAGFALRVHTRTRSKAKPLEDRGASWADSPVAAAEGAEVVFSMVGDPADVESVHLGPQGTLAAKTPPRVIVDMTTSRPSLAVRLSGEAARRGVESVDAPVSGGDLGARNAALSIMVGGESRAVAMVRPILERLGRQIVHHGGPGAGQHAKMVNQIMIASNMLGMCEGLLYAGRAGLDLMKVLESVGAGAAGSWSISNLAPRIVKRNFAPGFFVDHFVKDLGIALEESARLGIAMPGLALARQLYEAVRAQGHGRLGSHALMLAMERLNGIPH